MYIILFYVYRGSNKFNLDSEPYTYILYHRSNINNNCTFQFILFCALNAYFFIIL